MGPAECAERSAALVVDMARRVGLKAQNQNANLNLQITIPPKIFPAPLRIPPGRSKISTGLILWFCRSNSQCRAGSHKTIDDGICYEYASKMQASNCFFYAFHVSTHFLHHIFQNSCSCSSGEHIFAKRLQAILIKIHFFDPQTASIRAFFVIVFALFALLAVPIAIFSLHARIKILLLAAVPCIFRPQSPVSKNECMHRCNNFVNFVYDLLFSLCLPCFEHFFLQSIILFSENMLPALGGKHDFESGTKAKSWKMCLLGPPIMPVCTLFAPLIATWNLQNPLEKCVFFVYSPSSEAIFSIVCFIA